MLPRYVLPEYWDSAFKDTCAPADLALASAAQVPSPFYIPVPVLPYGASYTGNQAWAGCGFALDSEGQGGLACCGSRGGKESDTT